MRIKIGSGKFTVIRRMAECNYRRAGFRERGRRGECGYFPLLCISKCGDGKM